MASALDAVVASIGQVLSGLSATIGTLTNNLNTLAGPTISNLINNLGSLSININQLTTSAFNQLINAINYLSNNLNNFRGQFNNISVAFNEVKNITKIIAAPVELAANVFGGLINSVFQAKDAFMTLAKTTALYVKAFSPAAFKLFENALYDLQAVIGSLLLPVLQAFTLIIRTVADTLVPIVQKLEPAFIKISKLMISVLAPVLNSLFNIIDRLVPIIENFADVFGPLANKIGEFVSLFADEIGKIIISLAESFLSLATFLMPVIDGFMNLATSVIPYTSEVLLLMASAVVGVTTALLVSFLPAIIAAGGALWTALSPILVPALLIAGAFYAVVKAAQWFTSWFSKKKKEDKKDLFKPTGASVGYGAREAKYQSVEELSRNLIASAYSSAASIEKQMLNVEKQQLEVLQKIAGQGRPQGPQLGVAAPGIR